MRPTSAAAERRALTIAPLGDARDGPTLDAVLELPAAGTAPRGCVVVCHPHPLYGGDRESSVVRAIADGALAAGLAALRFDFRGVGASTGAYDEGLGERDDARAARVAAAAQPEVDATRVALAGYSFGGGVAASVLAEAIAAGEAGPPALALVASSLPPPDEVHAALVGYARPLLLSAGERDAYASADAIATLAAERAPSGAVTETLVAPGADHFWIGSEALLTEHTCAFFAGALAG